jgi:hypothetical protein
MKFSIAAGVAAVLFAALPVMAYQAAPKQPHPKNKEELAALQKVQAAAQSGDPDQQLAAINNVLENFVDTDYKPMLISMGLQAAERKNDMALIQTWVDRAEQADPNSIEARVVLAEATARHTRENDLDKADSLKKINTNANQALDLLKAADKPPLGVADAQWPDLKKQLTAQAYGALGLGASLDKKPADSVTDYKAGLAADPTNPVLKAYLAKAYVENKQYDEAISLADQILADGSAPASVKQFAQQQKDNATKLKGAK